MKTTFTTETIIKILVHYKIYGTFGRSLRPFNKKTRDIMFDYMDETGLTDWNMPGILTEKADELIKNNWSKYAQLILNENND